jgi:hypothetical protein
MCTNMSTPARTSHDRRMTRAPLAVCLAGATAAAMLAGACGGADADQPTINRAKQAYEAAKARGVDMSRGPCLGVIEPGWVADVAHDPRQDVDDDPANQCEAYRSGEADHFVELDPDGQFIRSG